MIILVHAKPRSKQEKIEKISSSEYIIYIKEPAENNKANKRIINLLAKELNISYTKITLKNPRSRKKQVEIKGL